MARNWIFLGRFFVQESKCFMVEQNWILCSHGTTGVIPILILCVANTVFVHAVGLCAVPELILCAGTNMGLDSTSGL